MKELKNYAAWTFHNTWVTIFSYIFSKFVLLFFHFTFGFSKAEDGTYFSNALPMCIMGFVLALGTGILQRELLKEYFKISFFWVLSLIIGFVIAESIAGIVLWKMEIYRGLINVFNKDVHFTESLIFGLAGLISGILQVRLLKPYYNKRFYWIISSTLGWAIFILLAYLSVFGIILGAVFYSAITGIAFYKLLESKTIAENTN